ncbi:intraflagellar transport-associated protein isoform X2 [Ambystoma mexicanum]|uniref:intraflagellar transport-associated protein isoform X2 n=1 Tax=Ambystoma mexicanum TaxID=8296 RepID=UPI0037E76CE8
MPEDSSEGCVSYGQNDIMEEDEKMQEVLNQFVNSHEQTYEEFLNTFTHLSRETKDLRGRTPDGLLVENIAPTAPLSHRNTTPTSSPPPEEDQIVIDAGRLVGGCNLDDRPLSGMFKVDNFFEADTFEADGEMDQKTAVSFLRLTACPQHSSFPRLRPRGATACRFQFPLTVFPALYRCQQYVSLCRCPASYNCFEYLLTTRMPLLPWLLVPQLDSIGPL